MACCIALLALFSPRVALFCIALFSDLPSRAMDGVLLPLLGFFLLPWTTLAYIVLWQLGSHEVAGIEWFFVALAFLTDIGAYGSGARARD
ncbi:MAG: hypothetical protein QM679_01655 [Patulibacter sp.]